MKSCDFYCKRHILAWMHVVWAILRQNRLGGSDLQRWAGKKGQKVTRGSHRNDVSPLTQGLRYRAACDIGKIWKRCMPSIPRMKSISGTLVLFLSDIAEKWFRPLVLTLSLCGLSVCLYVTFVHCAQIAEDIDTISFAYDSSMSLPDRVEIQLTAVNPFLPKFCSKLIHRLFFRAS